MTSSAASHLLPVGGHPPETAEFDRALLDLMDAHVAVLRLDGTIETVNAAWERFSEENGGDPSATGVGVNYLDVCTEAATGDHSVIPVLRGLRRVLRGADREFSSEYPCHSPTVQRWFHVRARRTRVGGLARVVVVHQDVSENRRLQEDVRARSLLLDEVDAAVIATDLDGVVELWNSDAERLYGWTAEAAVGRPLRGLLQATERLGAPHDVVTALSRNGKWEGLLTVTRADGSQVPVEARSTYVHDGDGLRSGIVSVSVDLSLRVAMEEQLARSNRELKAITDSIGDGLCVLDADGRITYINPRAQQLLDAYVTEALGVRLTRWMHRPDGARIDNLTEVDPSDPAEASLRRSDGSDIPVEYVMTSMVGRNAHDPAGWVVVFRDISERRWREARISRELEETRWIARIRDALAEDGFVLYSQPIFDLATEQVVQHELLVRMRDPEDPDNIIPPGRFLPIAEAFGLAREIDRWVLRQGLRVAATGMAVQLNVSATSLDDTTLPHLIEQLLAETGADPKLVVFEITETALVDSTEHAISFAQRVNALGCALALDDFGTGYGGFTYLKQLPIDELKIDMEFVRDATTNPASRHVIDAVVSLARAFGVRTGAEGVEDQPTLQLLRALDVDLAQGYLLGRPAPLDPEVTRRMQERPTP